MRKDVLLGRFGSQESREHYARVIAEWEQSRRCIPPCFDKLACQSISDQEGSLFLGGTRYADAKRQKVQGLRKRDIAHLEELVVSTGASSEALRS